MLDIDFLRSEKPTLRQHTLYVYRSGFFRTQVRQRLTAILEARGFEITQPAYPHYTLAAWEASLFSLPALILDFESIPEHVKAWRTPAEQLLAEISKKTLEAAVVYLVPHDSPLLETEAWVAATKVCTVLTEVKAAKETCEKLLDFLAPTEAGFDLNLMPNKAALLGSFQEVLTKVNMEFWDLPDFATLFSLLLETCFDQTTHEFNLSAFRKVVTLPSPTDFYKLHQLLFEFLTHRDAVRFSPLFQYLENQERYAFKDSRQLLGTLYKATRDLLTVNGDLNPKFEQPEDWSAYRTTHLRNYKSLSPRVLYFWQILLLKWEMRLNTYSFMPEFQSLALELQERMAPL